MLGDSIGLDASHGAEPPPTQAQETVSRACYAILGGGTNTGGASSIGDTSSAVEDGIATPDQGVGGLLKTPGRRLRSEIRDRAQL